MPIYDAITRRQALVAAGGLPAGFLAATAVAQTNAGTKPVYRYGLNMSTVRGHDLTAPQQVDLAGKAGYDAVEPWIRDLNRYREAGGSLKDLCKRIKDQGLTVESAIGFAPWIVDDDVQRDRGLEEAKRDMDVIAQLGGSRIAAPPAGVPRGQRVSLENASRRYHALLEVGDQTGVVPQVEMWGGNSSIGKVSAAVLVAIESGHPKACFLGDVYHTYKGGCDFDGLRMLGPQALQVFHFNDYPADPPRETIRDEHRVYPGDGIAPLTDILRGFVEVAATPVLSLELFNPSYWKQDALQVARTGLQKMRKAVQKAFG